MKDQAKLFGQKDTATAANPAPQDSRKKAEESAKGLLKNILNKKKPADTTKKQ
jgi:hypothetical protein